jgi:hypothetical protein
MRMYSFYSKRDDKKEKLGTIPHVSRLQAAKFFAERKQLSLKSFLNIYTISK